MIHHTKLALMSIFALCATQLFSTSPEIEIWSDGVHYRYLIKDYRVDYADCQRTKQQHDAIIWAARQKQHEGAFVLAEDPLDYSGEDPDIQQHHKEHFASKNAKEIFAQDQKQQLEINNSGNKASPTKIISTSPLQHLIQSCKQHNIASYNTECDQAINCYEITKDTIAEIIVDITNHVEAMRDCKELKESIDIFLQRAHNLEKTGATLPIPEFKKRAIDIRDHLVDLKTVYKLIQWKNIKHGFICEGQWHIENIKSDLKNLGYQCMHSFGNAQIWDMPEQTKKQKKEIVEVLLKSALNIKQTFHDIFAVQQEQEKEKYLRLLNQTDPQGNIPFLQSRAGQKFLNQINVHDQKQSAESLSAALPVPLDKKHHLSDAFDDELSSAAKKQRLTYK